MKNLSFIERASIGIEKVREQYPSALLLEVGAWHTTGTTSNPDELHTMRIVFSFEDSKSISIKSFGGGIFEEPILHDKPFVEDMVIQNWPLEMDLPEALSLIQEAGLQAPFTAVTLRQPVAPGFDDPLYIVGSAGNYVSVNTVTKKIQPIQTLLGSQWADITICAYGLTINGVLKVSCGTDPAEKVEHKYTYPDGACTSHGQWGNFNNWSTYGAEGTLALKDGETLICTLHYDSPYSGSNKFYIDNNGYIAKGYDVKITSYGNRGHTGYLGDCSLNVIKS